jgi:electron transfer flavoprotein alpha subunit
MSEKEHNGVLVFAEQKNGEIHKVSYELLGKGKELANKLKAPLYAGVLGPAGVKAEELIYRGAEKVFYIEGDEFNEPEELIYKDNLLNLINDVKPEIVLIGATTLGRSLAPRLAAALNTGLTADCTGLVIDDDSKLVQIRPAFSENILAHIKTDVYPQMATVRYKEFPEAKRDVDLKGEVVKVKPLAIGDRLVKVIEELHSEDFDISDASVVVAGGKGLKSAEDFRMLEELADLLGGVVGGSRPVVDEGYISKEHQIGYSGNRVKAKLYVACGISGAPQHLAGMGESEVIIAINSDPSAPIFNTANFGIVGDLYKVIPEFVNKLKSLQSV